MPDKHCPHKKDTRELGKGRKEYSYRTVGRKVPVCDGVCSHGGCSRKRR